MMADHKIPLEDISRIDLLDISGDLHLSGWNREEIRVKDLSKEIRSEKKKNILEISSSSDVFLNVPHALEVNIKSVSSDATIKGMRGKLEIKSISGDLIISDVSALSVDSISGDLIASRILGDLQANSISGDSLIDNVQGQVELKGVSGDIHIDTVGGGIDAKASGSGTLNFHPVPWQAYQLQVSGDLSLTIPADTSADLTIKSGARDITIFPGKLDITSTEPKLEHTLGEGGPAILLTAGGKVFIIDDEFTVLTGMKMNLDDLGSLAAGFTTNTTDYIRKSMSHLETELRESLSGLSESLEEIGLSEENLRELGAQIEESSRKAAEKAEIAAIKAQAKVEKKIAKARSRALKAQEKSKQFDLSKFLEAASEKKAVSDSERMLILEMLQAKKISAEEAEDLLKALEGKK
ncbi:MAG TPA: hypothetical protein ENG59_00490 [Chloroflexi bacterium]|nr:hypothetical protein [Chloroflexota bacterium]